MKQQEWVNSFKVLYGRNPSPQEFTAAKAANFPAFQHEELKMPEVPKVDQVGTNQDKGKFNLKFDIELVAKVVAFILVGIFGYVLGYLF